MVQPRIYGVLVTTLRWEYPIRMVSCKMVLDGMDHMKHLAMWAEPGWVKCDLQKIFSLGLQKFLL